MRVAVAGKGGAGKTTLSATLARLYARGGRQVVAVDDDPNPNLAVALGVPEPARAGLGRLAPEILQEALDAAGNRRTQLAMPLDEVAARHGVRGPDGVVVLQGIGILGPGRG